MEELTRLIKEDMKPALGVTEPGAIAYAAAEAVKRTKGRVKKVKVLLNSGMYKNAYTCGIPNSNNYGNLYAAALGAAAAKAELGLEALRDITPEDDKRAAEMVTEGKIEVYLDHIGSDISIDVSVEAEEGECTVQIRRSHTHISGIKENGVYVYRDEGAAQEQDAGNEMSSPPIHQYSLHDLLTYVQTVPLEELAFIREAFSMNMELLEEGLDSDRAVIASFLLKENGGRMISDDARKTAQLFCNGAIEARVLGFGRPAMSITGSGAHGIIAVMPLYACYKTDKESTDDGKLLRAAALSYLITMYIKEYSGKLSAFCGCGIAAGTGMACGLGFMRGADEEQTAMILQNMAGGLTGMICDGGNHGCAMKGIVAVDAAFRAAEMALGGVCIESIHGIIGRTPEDTMRNIGRIASPGMVETEKTIVQIMEEKNFMEEK